MNQPAPKTWSNAFTSLVIPIALGLILYLCLGLIIDREVVTNELLLRYLTGHPISRITSLMFCIGVASLLIIANNVFDQFCNCDKITLGEMEHEGSNPSEQTEANLALSPAERASAVMERLVGYKWSIRSQYLWNRLYGALSFIKRTNSASGIEDELKYLADTSLEQQQRRYSLIRIVIWATPMLGFLGTVLGISQALGGIQVGPDNDFQTMLNSLRGSLFVAFDTTALALTLSMLLMFFQFFVERFELQLLDAVQRRANEELVPFYEDGEFLDPQTRAVERIGRSVLATTHHLVKQQADQWQQSMATAEVTWEKTITGVSETVRHSLSDSLRVANLELADSITRGIDRADESMAKRWEQWQVLLSENARQIGESQKHVLSQVALVKELLQKIESANGAQHMLNRNLDALAATSQLHTTLKTLAESIEDIKKQARPVEENQVRPGLRIHRQHEETTLPLAKSNTPSLRSPGRKAA